MAPTLSHLHWLIYPIFILRALVQPSQAQTPTQGADYFAPLKDLETPAPRGLANQNFTRCCLRALDDWRNKDGNPDIVVESSRNPSKIFSNADDLATTGSEEQFPCGAVYDEKPEGATIVKISYGWCKANCGGWQRSRSKVLEQWVQPFVGFILPAAVFCLNVPRKVVINIPNDLFMDVLQELVKKWTAFVGKAEKASTAATLSLLVVLFGESFIVICRFLFGALLAATIGFLNVVVWVVIVFATAAPMILSGLYEATIDRQVIRSIEKDILSSKKRLGNTSQTLNDRVRIRYQIHLLYATLVGNLMIRKPSFSGWNNVTTSTAPKTRAHAFSARNPEDEDRAWADVEVLMHDLDNDRVDTGAQLKTMLQCQASFGATIGAPVAFYLGSFLFSVFGNHAKLGDSDVSLSLAFGEWWMTIPHVAIVSGCLLAGNNPNTLEAIASGVERLASVRKSSIVNQEDVSKNVSKEDHSTLKDSIPSKGMLAPFYDSVYQPVWMWERGRNKRNWFIRVREKYVAKLDAIAEQNVAQNQATESKISESKVSESKVADSNITEDNSPLLLKWLVWVKKVAVRCLSTPELLNVPSMGYFQAVVLTLTASILIIIPFVLAYVTSFYTPIIGLSCRSFTFVLYIVFQSLLTIAWVYDFNTRYHQSDPKSTVFYFLTFLFFTGSVFTAFIGTFMQILGVYRNCLCNLPMKYWSSRNYQFTVSSNTKEGIYYAERYWLSTGIASICLLVIFCYIGWWYQRHWRMRFEIVVGKILHVDNDDQNSDVEQGKVTTKAASTEQSGSPAATAPRPGSPVEGDDLQIEPAP